MPSPGCEFEKWLEKNGEGAKTLTREKKKKASDIPWGEKLLGFDTLLFMNILELIL